MYESITYDVIMNRMLAKVIESNPDIDTREGSLIFDALAPAAVELQLIYIEFDVILNETFADTASRPNLIKRAAERGVIVYPSTTATLRGEFTPSSINIPIGSRFSLGGLNYFTKSKTSDGNYQMQCETAGIIGNQFYGVLVPINYIAGLATARLAEVLIPGEDEEATEDLRERYFASFETKAFGGNKTDYLEKTNALPGVGSTKVTPNWNGGSTVKLTILDSDFNKASSALISAVQVAIDPTQDGQGLGIAPIGHIVTVNTPAEVVIDVTATITYDDGYGTSIAITQAVSDYLLELRTSWADQGSLIVRTAQIETKLLAITGILDIANTKINGVANNLTLSAFQIPTLGTVTA